MITIRDIQMLTTHCLNMLFCAEELQRDSNTKKTKRIMEDILKSVRKLYIGALMYEKTLICVSGLQGVGKTTLMKNFYGIDKEYLNISFGRGERIPLLITEKEGIKEPSMRGIIIDKDNNGRYVRKEQEMTKAEFVEATRGEDSKIMYLELYVPFRHTFNEGVSFVLLPGFEKGNNYWNNLIEFSVNSSDAAVFVFNETSFSNAENEDHLRAIQEKFKEGMVYVISGADGSSDDNLGVKRTCMERLGIPDDEEDRVVCVGEYGDRLKNEKWIKNFREALEKYAYKAKTQCIQSNSRHLYSEIEKMKDGLYQILDILEADGSDAYITELKDAALLKAFDKKLAAEKNKFEKILKTKYSEAEKKSIENLAKSFNEERKFTIKSISRLFLGPDVKTMYTEKRKMIEKALLDEKGKSLPDMYLQSALECTLRSLDQPSEKTYIGQLIDTERKEEKTELNADGCRTIALKDDLCELLADKSDTDDNRELKCQEPRKLMGAIVELGTYHYGLLVDDEIAKQTGWKCYMPEKAELVPDDMNNVVADNPEATKKFVGGMAGLLGIDLVEDGAFNLISKIGESLSLTVPQVRVAAGLVIGTGAAMVALRDLNRMQCADFQSARIAVNCIYEDIRHREIERYDMCMARIRERIEDNLARLSGREKQVIANYNVKAEVNNAFKLLEKFSKEYAEDIYGLEAAFAE